MRRSEAHHPSAVTVRDAPSITGPCRRDVGRGDDASYQTMVTPFETFAVSGGQNDIDAFRYQAA